MSDGIELGTPCMTLKFEYGDVEILLPVEYRGEACAVSPRKRIRFYYKGEEIDLYNGEMPEYADEKAKDLFAKYRELANNV